MGTCASKSSSEAVVTAAPKTEPPSTKQSTAKEAALAKPPKPPASEPASDGAPAVAASAKTDVPPRSEASTDTNQSGTSTANTTPTTDASPKSLIPPSDGNAGNFTTSGTGYSSDTVSNSDRHIPGYSSGASTPVDDGSVHSRDRTYSGNGKSLIPSGSILGLDKMIDNRREEGDLKSNVVHIEVPFGKPIEEVYDGVHTGPVLGSGISGLVRLVTHKATKIKYAVKCLDLGLVETEEGLQQLREEIYIMCQLDHPNIVRLEEVYESHSEIYLVQELCLGGELFDRLDEQPDYHYTEAQCARLVKQMLCSVRYLHSKGIIHRDLKLENFLFSSTSPDSELKMIDFGLSKHFKFGEVQHEAVGTPYTVSPEVIRGSYDERCDIWAIGVITFLLLSGDPPFGGCGGPEPLMVVRSNILKGQFRFEPEEIWENVSQQAREFIGSLLVTNPNSRPTAKQAQTHPWLKEWAHRARKKDDNKLNPNVVKALVTFKEYSDMRKLLCEVLSFTLLPDQISDLRREFEKMDTDGSGEISLAALKQVLIENAGAGSLGALTEEEVEDIFNAMRVRKTETRIHWHEFIAAGLSQCKVDDRNLRLAFDRLDSDHKGYITFENIMDLMGNDAAQSEDAMRNMWGDSMKACNCNHARITYEDFLLLMKGQTKDGVHEAELPGVPMKPLVGMPLCPQQSPEEGSGIDGIVDLAPPMAALGVVHEVKSDHDGETTDEDELHKHPGQIVLPSGDVVNTADGSISTTNAADFANQRRSSTASADSDQRPPAPHPYAKSAPTTPMRLCPPTVNFDDGRNGPLMMEEDGPLMMDDGALDELISKKADESMGLQMLNNSSPMLGTNLTPPQSPTRSPVDFVTPMSNHPTLCASPALLSAAHPELVRRRSRSVDDQDTLPPPPDADEPHFSADARRAMALPEHNHNENEIEEFIKDETKTPLMVNRKLYRAHRQMRLAVLEATKRFEEEQNRRAAEIILQKQQENKGEGSSRFGAGLVMRHGHSRELSSESVRKLLKQTQQEQQTLVEKANRRGGRGRRSRKKTISDMSGMLSSPPPEELLMDAAPAPTELRAVVSEQVPAPPIETPLASSEGRVRDATVPGVFHKTVDPFKQAGIVGSMNSSQTSTMGNSIRSSNGDVLGNSVHSMKVSSSDGNLDKLHESESPSTTASPPENEMREATPRDSKSNWPPPPPL